MNAGYSLYHARPSRSLRLHVRYGTHHPATWNTVIGKQVHVNNQANRLSSFDLCVIKEVA